MEFEYQEIYNVYIKKLDSYSLQVRYYLMSMTNITTTSLKYLLSKVIIILCSCFIYIRYTLIIIQLQIYEFSCKNIIVDTSNLNKV